MLAARYRRAFLTLGGNATATAPVSAFESMYELEPPVLEALRQAIRRRR
jgi:hypothetical protein